MVLLNSGLTWNSMVGKCGATVACERSEHATGVRRFSVHFRVEPAGYPAGPPTDPDVTNSVIRFLGDRSVNTLRHMTLLPCKSLRTCSTFCWSFVEMVCDHDVSPIVPSNRASCPASPSLQRVPWTSVPRLPDSRLASRTIGTMVR